MAIVSITWDPQKDRCPGPTPRDSDQFLWSVTWVSEFLKFLRCECAAVVESHVPESFFSSPSLAQRLSIRVKTKVKNLEKLGKVEEG